MLLSLAMDIKIIHRRQALWNFSTAPATTSARFNQTDPDECAAMFNATPAVIALPGSRLTPLSGVNMGYVIALRSGFARLTEQARGWFQRSLQPRTGGPGKKQDDLYEIFLFCPHG